MLIGSLSIGDLTFVGSQANERIAAMEKSLEQLRKEAEKAPLLLVEMHFYQPAFQMWKCQSAVAGQRNRNSIANQRPSTSQEELDTELVFSCSFSKEWHSYY